MRLAEFTVNSDDLQRALQAIMKLAVPFNGTINIAISANGVEIESRAELSALKINLPILSCNGDIKLGVTFENLRLATAGKKGVLTFFYEDTRLKIEVANYSSAIGTIDFMHYEDIEEHNDLVFNNIDAATAAWMLKSTRAVQLKPNLTTPIMPVLVKLGQDESLVACYALDHLSFIKDSEFKTEKNIELSMPVETLVNILSVFDEFKLGYNDSVVVCKSDWASVSTALPATDAYIESSTLIDRLALFTSQEDGSELEFSKKEINDFLGNSKAVASKERCELIFDCQEKITKVERSTAFGNVRLELMKATKPCRYKLDGEYFAEALKQCKTKDEDDKVKIACYKDYGFTLINTQPGSYTIVALNKD